MKLLILISSLVIGLSAGSNVFAAERHSGLGLSAGLVCGTGFSYRAISSEDWGYHIGGIAILSPKYNHFNVGVQALRTLRMTSDNSFYLIGGIGFRTTDKETEYWTYAGDDTTSRREDDNWIYEKKRDKSSYLTIGVGIGMTFFFREDFGVSFELPMTYYKDGLYPGPQISLHYFFWD